VRNAPVAVDAGCRRDLIDPFGKSVNENAANVHAPSCENDVLASVVASTPGMLPMASSVPATLAESVKTRWIRRCAPTSRPPNLIAPKDFSWRAISVKRHEGVE